MILWEEYNKLLIDTRTTESMIASLTTYLNITEDELFQYIDNAASKARIDSKTLDLGIFEDEIIPIISTLQPKDQIDEIYVYHLTRRLNDSIGDKSTDNLKSLLLKDSPISKFLRQYNIYFVEKDGHPVIIFNNNEISLENSYEVQSSKSRDEKSRTFSSNSQRSHILRTSSRSIRLILSSIVSLAVSLKWTRTI